MEIKLTNNDDLRLTRNNASVNVYERISGTDAAIDSINEEISGINSAVTSINEDIGGINSAVTSINDEIEDINSAVTSINDEIEDINSAVTSINEDIGDINSAVTSINELIIKDEHTISASLNDLETRKANVDEVDEAIEGVVGSVDAVDARVDTLSGAVDAVDARVDTLSGAVDAVEDKVEKLTYNGHEYVEIGGVKWAKYNIGADSETDYGLYFQWGDIEGYVKEQVGSAETNGKKEFLSLDYKYDSVRSGSIVALKYNTNDGKTVLNYTDDAATQKMGSGWRIPTVNEIQSLIDSTTHEYTYGYKGSGVNGMVFTDKTDSSKILFFPSGGYAYNRTVSNEGGAGHYWTNTRSSNAEINANALCLDNNGTTIQDYATRCSGNFIRGVHD